ncbi:hypothetical protein HY495_00315 [Candidatus Woesearchaeota archaeon]|nr:hypothetical protein [Candidatus Woesearchaeota archaeon]
MRLGIDLDGVLAEFIDSFLDFENQRYGLTLTKNDVHNYDLTTILGVNPQQLIQEFSYFYSTSGFYHLLPVTGAQSATEELAKDHQLYVITSRPPEIHHATEEWLGEHFPARFTSVHFSLDYLPQAKSERKEDICRDLGIDVMIDDSIKYLKHCAPYVKKTFLFDQPWNQQSEILSSLVRVKSWGEIIQNIRSSEP